MGLVLALLHGPVVSAVLWTPRLKLQEAKPNSICLALASSSLPAQPYDAVHSLRKVS